MVSSVDRPLGKRRLTIGAAALLLLATMPPLVGCYRGTGNGSTTSAGPLVLIVSGDTRGWIAPCGCTANQSGGMARRGMYVANRRKEANVIVVDAGGAANGTSQYDLGKFEAILRGELAMGLVAHNLGASEAELGALTLRKLAADLQVPFLSANLRDASGELLASPVRFAEANGLRVAIVGLISPALAPKPLQADPPREALLDLIAGFNDTDRPDCIVVLAYMPAADLRELAASVPEVDLVIGGPTGQPIPPERHGPTLVASATNKGKFIAEFTWDSKATPKGWQGKIVEMGASLADDPVQARNLKSFYARLEKLDLPASATSFAEITPSGAPEDFRIAGDAACAKCHIEDCNLLASSKHAHAWQTLFASGAHVDSYCQQCHTTGYGLPGGFVSIGSSPNRLNVGCESCHGPSAAHVLDERQPTPYAGRAADRCIACHDEENSPLFAFEAYWSKIKHGAKVSPAVIPKPETRQP